MIRVIYLIAALFIFSCNNRQAKISNRTNSDTLPNKQSGENFQILIGTFRGSAQRNYYGKNPPDSLNVKWKIHLGIGKSSSYRKNGNQYWQGAGWTGQPLLTLENDSLYLYQGSLDHNLKKFRVSDGKLIWEYKFDDVIKGTGTIFALTSESDLTRKYVIAQGSRRGYGTTLSSKYAFSFRAISAITGESIWKFNVRQTQSFSRDADGSPLLINDTLYAGFENGVFSVIDPLRFNDKLNYTTPLIIKEINLFPKAPNRSNIVIESSPVLLGQRIYIAAGSGSVYGYNLNTKTIDWVYPIGSDLDGTPAVSNDSCLLVPVEKQYIPGNGGLLKLNPNVEPENSVEWFLPTGNKNFLDWAGGIVSSPAVNTLYEKINNRNLAVVSGIDGYLYLIDTDSINASGKVKGFDNSRFFNSPVIYDKYKIGQSISSPLIIDDIVIAASYNGLYLFRVNDELKLMLTDDFRTTFEATPIVYDGKIYIGSKDGFLYCFGN